MERTIIELKSVHLIDMFGHFHEMDKENFLAEFLRNPDARGFRIISNNYRIASSGKIGKVVKNKIEYYLRGVEMSAKEIVEHRPITKRTERVLRQILAENAGQEDKLIFIYSKGSYFLKRANVYTIGV